MVDRGSSYIHHDKACGKIFVCKGCYILYNNVPIYDFFVSESPNTSKQVSINNSLLQFFFLGGEAIFQPNMLKW